MVDAQRYLLSEQTVSHSHRDYFLHCSHWRCRHPLSSLSPRPASGPCQLPALSHQHPGYTARCRGPLFGTAPHQACLKPVKLVFMMPGSLPFPRPPITQVNKDQAPAGPLGAGSVLTPSTNPQNRLQKCQDCSAPHSSSGRLTRSCRKSLFRTHHSRLFTHVISPPIFHAKCSKQGPEGFPALPGYTVSVAGVGFEPVFTMFGGHPSAHGQGSCSQGYTSRPVVEVCFLFVPTSPCGRRLFPQPQ